ncbi:MAG: peptide transporter, partial [Phycisphaeraceae bacterium]
LTLFMGQSLGPAARWVTVILFAEVAKRSMKDLKQQEVYLLFYMAGIAMTGAMAEVGNTALSGGILAQLLWNQYLVEAPAMKAMGVASQVPEWVAPSAEMIEQQGNTFLTRAWAGPIAFLLGVMILNRVDNFGLGYALYRLTAHVERLPFPMAPVGALGISALSETREERGNRWRWRWFSIGGVLGLSFGLIYVGVPAITGSVFGQTVEIIPIPWLDLTPQISSSDFMPAVPINIVFDASFLVLGMVLPFWAVVGGFVGLVVTYIMNPILFRTGNLTSWEEGMNVVDTLYSNHVDFYLSFSIGLAAAIFLISLGTVVLPLYKRMRGTDTPADANQERMTLQRAKQVLKRNPARGDLSIWLALFIYVASTIGYILLAEFLIDGFPALFFLGFAFIYQPIISYVTAKLEGLVGQVVQIPMVREAAYIFSGYQGAAIWFAPIPINDYGRTTQDFRVMELLGTRVTDVIKIEILAVPILAGASLLFCELIWRLGDIPSPMFPFTQEVWDLKAKMFALHVTATAEGTSQFLEAIKFDVIGYGLVSGVGAYAILSYMHLPTFLVFGAVRGLGQSSPGAMIMELIGALIGRFYLQPKLGHQRYKQYVAILFAGYSAGVGLIAMGAVAVALIARSTTPLGY